jgi:hypothetical protein
MFIIQNRALGVLAALCIAGGFVVFSAQFDALDGEGSSGRQGTVTASSVPTARPSLSVVPPQHQSSSTTAEQAMVKRRGYGTW